MFRMKKKLFIVLALALSISIVPFGYDGVYASEELNTDQLDIIVSKTNGELVNNTVTILSVDENTIELNVEEEGEEIPEGTELNMQVILPEFMKDVSSLYIKHVTDSGYNYYAQSDINRGRVKFKNNHGLSKFIISKNEFNDPKFTGKSLLLSDDLGVNFYMHIPEEYLGGEMHFEITGKGTCDPDITSGEYVASTDEYKFSCNINSLQMAEIITATYVKGNYKRAEDYSVVDYLKLALEKGSPKMKELASDVYAYGYYAQQYLSGENNFELGTGDDQYTEMDVPEEEPDTSIDMSDYELSEAANGNTNIIDVTKSLTLDSDITIKLFCELANNSTYSESKKPAVTVDKKALDPSKISFNTNGGQKNMVLEISGITAGLMGHTYRVVIDNNYTIKVSALSYAYSLMQTGEEGAKNLATTLYEYYESAMNFVGMDMEHTITTYTINYCQGNGNEKAGTEKTQVVYCDEDINLFGDDTYNAPSGKSFVGWSTSLDGQTKTYSPGEKVRNLVKPGRTINLYAQYHKPVGGKIWYVDNSKPDPAKYTFYDKKGKKLVVDDRNYKDLSSAMYYEADGTSGFAKYYVVATENGDPGAQALICPTEYAWFNHDNTPFPLNYNYGTYNYKAFGQGKAGTELVLYDVVHQTYDRRAVYMCNKGSGWTIWTWIQWELRNTKKNNCNDWFIGNKNELVTFFNNVRGNMNTSNLNNRIFWPSDEETTNWKSYGKYYAVGGAVVPIKVNGSGVPSVSTEPLDKTCGHYHAWTGIWRSAAQAIAFRTIGQ